MAEITPRDSAIGEDMIGPASLPMAELGRLAGNCTECFLLKHLGVLWERLRAVWEGRGQIDLIGKAQWCSIRCMRRHLMSLLNPRWTAAPNRYGAQMDSV